MTTFLLVRHAEADYSGPNRWGAKGWGSDIAPLTPDGVKQAKIKGSELAGFRPDIILCSSISRALETVLYLKNSMPDVPVNVEFDLHEWVPDMQFNLQTIEEINAVIDEMQTAGCEWPDGEERSWEPFSRVRKRALNVLERYTGYDRVFVLCHAMLISSIILKDRVGKIKNLEAFEYVI